MPKHSFSKLHPTLYTLHPRSGFTLLELIVSVSIFMMLTTLVIFTMRDGERGEQLRFAVEDLTTQIRTLQSYARTGKRFGTEVPKGGYGIALTPCVTDPCILMLFADVNGNDRFDNGEALSERVKLPLRVAFVGATESGNTLAGNPVLLVRPPYGDFRLADTGGVRANVQEVRLALTHRDLNKQKILVVNLISGQIKQQ